MVQLSDMSLVEVTSKPGKSKKCGCGAMIYAKPFPEGNWFLSKVVLEHTNHNPKPSKWKDIKKYKEVLPDLERRMFAKRKLHNYLANEKDASDNVTSRETDMSYATATMGERRSKLKDGDEDAIFCFVMRMQCGSQNFSHFIRHDDYGCIKDVLWVDARSKAAYEDFGDVVYFDTTYLTNEYDLPLVNFVGINHHGQTILLGCALISHEEEETFEWVFRTWLLCMDDRAPQVILTDQSPTMRKALATTMPETRHAWCLWYMLQKFPRNLGSVPRYQHFNKELKDAICNSYTVEEFERHWTSVISEYQLQENEWLRCLFHEKHMWVPAYTNHLFLAGIWSTMRVERFQSFFDGFVEKHTTLCEFVKGYCFAMEKRVRIEEDSDEDCARQVRGLATAYIPEIVFQKIYTDAKFKKLQIECQGVVYCHSREKKTVTDTEVEHLIQDRVWVEVPGRSERIITEDRRTFRVKFNTVTNYVSCECKLFEHSGILCRHCILLYFMHDLPRIPEKYILRRWRKDIHRKHSRTKVAYYDPSSTLELKRYHKMQVAFEDVCSKAMECDKTLGIVMQLITEMKLRVAECLGQNYVDRFIEFNGMETKETMSSVGFECENDD
ncbi:protein FAR-RED IMPAIRED RESPONSE 1-like [Chenopodium quinoa]|uniref:protein FAR-RED IMPAIRED RESPONSE 1-like n=1 Tax=Chenopodium quinoa TaxID=63459 RepID=UPI000B78D879|nr:protein FAR-RED IMPAIRED RESPONSE 1-like [Chenopodium quinoa]